MTAKGRTAGDDASTIAQRIRGPADEATGTYALEVIDGADRGARAAVDGSVTRVLVGTGPACHLRLTDRLVSRRHAGFELDGARLRAVDLESTNGTTIDGVAIERAFVASGATVRVGGTTLRVEKVDAAVEVPTSTAMAFGRVSGASLAMRRLYPLFERLAQVSVPVIVEGETGTGKEALAESLHEAGPRAAAPFVVFDCTTVAPTLMESALFGHERGAFTGATNAVRGAFERAHGGTLLIDEIGELDVALQAKLLRAIERAEVQRIGSERTIKVDVRVLAATRRDLDREIQEGRFRDDLFFRLAVARVELPPLRRRGGDIGFLARHFWKQLGGDPAAVPYEALARFERYEWPGNVRELFNAVLRLATLGELAGASARASEAPPRAAATTDPIAEVLALGLPLPRARERVVHELERRYVEKVLAEHGGSVSRAAAASGIALRYFQMIRARTR